MCVFAHPDDESIGMGGTLARYAREQVRTYVVTATRGERGRHGTLRERPTPEALGAIREREARAAGAVLGVHQMWFLGHPDGGLDRVNSACIITEIAGLIRLVRPQVVVTLPPDGIDGHPDHIAISQIASSAVLRAADADCRIGEQRAHVVSKLYYLACPAGMLEAYQETFGRVHIVVDGEARGTTPWPPWAVTTVLDTSDLCGTVWEAVQCHATQMAGRQGFARPDEERHRTLWGTQRFSRVISLVNGGRALETDLFEGLR